MELFRERERTDTGRVMPRVACQSAVPRSSWVGSLFFVKVLSVQESLSAVNVMRRDNTKKQRSPRRLIQFILHRNLGFSNGAALGA